MLTIDRRYIYSKSRSIGEHDRARHIHATTSVQRIPSPTLANHDETTFDLTKTIGSPPPPPNGSATTGMAGRPRPIGSATWLDYHARLRPRCCPRALVPVRELVSDSGLGYPTGYLGTPRVADVDRPMRDERQVLRVTF